MRVINPVSIHQSEGATLPLRHRKAQAVEQCGFAWAVVPLVIASEAKQSTSQQAEKWIASSLRSSQ
jgi:hypothetical protein